MKTKVKAVLFILLIFAIGALSMLYIGNPNYAVLSPKGLIGEKERDLIITASLLMLIVVIPVFILTLAFAWRYRASNEKARHAPDWEHNYIAEYCWWGVPIIIIIVLAIITWTSSHELNPFKPLVSDKKPLKIQVVALNWKWLFIYPEQKIATVNLVQFPEKTPISFEITSDAPMNGFWIPALGGQIYAMPAMRSKLHLIASGVGTYRGSSTNISGDGFASMYFTAKSTTEEEFQQWVQTAQQSPKQLDLKTYAELVKPSEYEPVAYYTLAQDKLFDRIIMRYMRPTK